MRGVKKRGEETPRTALGIACLASASSFDRAIGVASCGHALFGEAVGYPARRLAAIGERVPRLSACLTCLQFATHATSDGETVGVME